MWLVAGTVRVILAQLTLAPWLLDADLLVSNTDPLSAQERLFLMLQNMIVKNSPGLTFKLFGC